MQNVDRHAVRYDGTTMLFHWLTALLVAGQWLGAQTIDWFPKGPLRVDVRSLHITFGTVLACLLVARLVWRVTGGRRLRAADPGPLQVLARATHWGLYALLLAMVSVGMFLAWARGDSLFNLVRIPAYAPGDHDFADRVQDIHATIGWMIVGLAGFHAAAALVHRYVWRDTILARMLPGKRGAPPTRAP
jgi:cytochrome b561